MTDKVSLIGVPSDIGASDRGACMGPEALRVAGIDKMLKKQGCEVRDIGNLEGPKNPEQPPVDGYRHLEENIAWANTIADSIYSEMKDGRFPIMMGGDHAMSVGSVAAVAKYCAEQEKPICILWIDAHADYNTNQTSPSGNIHGMPVAVATGLGHPDLLAVGHAIPMVKPENVYQIAIRSVDKNEKKLVIDSGINVYDMRRIDEIGIRQTMQEILHEVSEKNAHLHVSFDVDSLDPSIAPGVATTIPGGLTYREAQLCMEMVHDSGLMGSLDIAEINPALDTENSTAKIAVDLTASLFGRQIFPIHSLYQGE
ncbi:arginase [Pseudemcibacter aquimaris]|uniref:arginase n=1 Tax=Pseudemcibacter aquimaris TaxID=2857064 RepID=UPI002011343A|nr:arginase [Pseudemcibacter aquimaris]MCC3860665.1 arginase [Pseudemcibacter aquimaris]WDU59485.1 arginase [Pseudemcibacter aquimaris]